MRNVLTAVMAFCLCLCLCACADPEPATDPQETADPTSDTGIPFDPVQDPESTVPKATDPNAPEKDAPTKPEGDASLPPDERPGDRIDEVSDR